MVEIIIDVNMANVATCPSLGQAGGCLVVAGVCSNVVLGTSNFNLQKILLISFPSYYVASASTIACGLRNDDIVSVGHNMSPGQMAWSMIHDVPIKLNQI